MNLRECSEYRNASFTLNGLRLEPRGIAKFNLGGNSYLVKIRRISGNGLIILNDHLLIIHSKQNQDIILDLIENLKIHRPKNAIGEIEINLIEENMLNVSKWKNIISKCESYRSISIINNKLLAVSGAYLEKASQIEQIETNPPKMYIFNKDRIEFLGPCEIIALEVMGEAKEKKSIFGTISPPNYLSRPEPLAPLSASTNIFQAKPMKQKIEREPIIFYDSKSGGLTAFQSKNTKLAKTISSNGSEYIALKSGGAGSLPLPLLLKAYTQYVLVITCKKLFGNGKFEVRIDQNAPQTVIADTNFSDQYILIETAEPPNLGQAYKLNFNMANTTGDLLISRLRLIFGLTLSSAKQLDTSNKQIDNNQYSLNVNFGTIKDINGSEVTKNLKRYARFISSSIDPKWQKPEIRGTIRSNTFNGLGWLNKITSFYPNVQLDLNKKSTNGLGISEISAPLNSNTLWLEPFFPSEKEEIDPNVKLILSPSRTNVEFLKKKFPNKQVEFAWKPWPYLTPHKIKNLESNYILVTNRNHQLTQKIIDKFDPFGPYKLVIIGARGNYPNYIHTFNEYLSYPKLLYLILNCKLLIDLTEHHYDSALLHLAEAGGVPILSNNWFVMDKPNCQFLLNTANLEQNIQESLNKSNLHLDLSNYNKHLDQFVNYFD